MEKHQQLLSTLPVHPLALSPSGPFTLWPFNTSLEILSLVLAQNQRVKVLPCRYKWLRTKELQCCPVHRNGSEPKSYSAALSIEMAQNQRITVLPCP
ncbi:hypothetical protein ACOMHN_037325 [Nucella lapillus]